MLLKRAYEARGAVRVVTRHARGVRGVATGAPDSGKQERCCKSGSLLPLTQSSVPPEESTARRDHSLGAC